MTLSFVDISHAYGARKILDGINLVAQAGEITCLFGASGCGKTTLLRIAAGLIPIQQGSLVLDGELLGDPRRNPPPEARPVGLVFQEGALFPHMTVAENIGFGVSNPRERSAIVRLPIEQIGLVGREGAYPHALSGGQQQRVALARALAPQPRVILLDEPFASIDVVFRRALREETRRILKAQGAMAILVTHDPEEAAELGDQIAVMGDGKIVHHSPPSDLYDHPSTAEVAELFGNGQRVAAHRESGGLRTSWGIWTDACLRSRSVEQESLVLVVRPGDLTLTRAPEGATIEDIRIQSTYQKVSVLNKQGDRLLINASREADLHVGETVRVTPGPGTVFSFPASR